MTSVEHIARIVADQELDVCTATTMDGKGKLDYFEGSPADVATYIGYMNDAFVGPFKVTAYRSTAMKRRGRKSDSDEPFLWTLKGQPKDPAPAPMAAAPAAPMVREVPVPDAVAIREAAAADARATVAEYKTTAMEERLKELEEEDDEEEDEEEEDDAPPPGAQPWYMNGEETVRVARELGLLELVRGIFKKDAPAVPRTEGITEEERELIELARRWKISAPDQYKEVTGNLRETFKENGHGNGQA